MKRQLKRVNVFSELRESLADAVEFEGGRNGGLKVSEIVQKPKPMSSREIILVRKRLGLSQELFARAVNASPNAVRSWEQGTRRPGGTALKLLTVAKHSPEALFKKRA